MKKKDFKSHYLNFHFLVLNDENLTTLDRVMISLIAALDNGIGCRASNSYLAAFANCSICSVSRSISKLVTLKYIIYNEDNSGRGYIRHVRKAVKYNPVQSSASTTRVKPTSLASQKAR